MFGRAIVVATMFALAAGSAEAAVVYNQPSNNFGSYASQNDTNTGGLGNFATTYDNFTLGSSADLQSVDFTGSYFNPPTQGLITAFTISIYGDLGSNSPGASLYSTTVPGNGGETSLGTDTLGDPVFSYAEDISFLASGGTEYWLSIVPDVGLPPQWGWENSAVGDGLGYQLFFGTLGPITSDFAFTLNDTPVSASVPEPFTLALFGTGLAAAIATRRRRRAKA